MTEQTAIRWDRGDDGVVVLTLDDPTQSANTMNQLFQDSFAATLDRLEAEQDTVTGVVITSGKKTFFAGGDLNLLRQASKDTAGDFFAHVEAVKRNLRRLEKLGRPVVAAVNGSALGGGLEIALACHHRIVADDPKIQLGFPEVTLGLLPGAGGVVRTVRMLGMQKALTALLLQGQRLRPGKARELGIADEVLPADRLIGAAREWIAANPDAVQPWDKPGFTIPGGSPADLASMMPVFPATLRKQLKGAPMPAPHHILCAAVEGAQVDVDTALRIESRYFTDLATGQVAKHMIQAFFYALQHINGGGSRPQGPARYTARKVGVLGAGMMGAGIAYVCARAGMEVVLKDVSVEAAEKGKGYSVGLLDKAVGKGSLTSEKRDAILARITPTGEPADLAGCDLVIEAVFENTELKQQVFREIEDVVEPDALLCSNTSTLPITGLAEGVQRQQDFIGLHFFSPVDKMPLVEIIRGARTSELALAKAYDVVQQIGKTPIVVNDSRGFFTSRVIGTFINEGLAMLGEGVNPVTVERATTQAGYPVGVLQLSDELNLELMKKIRNEAAAAAASAGESYTPHPAEQVVDAMLAAGRAGRLKGAGFYDYPEGGARRLWPGLRDLFGPPAGQEPRVPFEELKERLLFVEALETVKCFEEGVITSTADANIGSIFGIGYPAWTGGVVQFMQQYAGGLPGFVARAEELAARYGDRFSPSPLLVKKAANGEAFDGTP
jgi:3-hydroxyacyl-CoA dehydrogenase/enoyl-CoA hydratase/3-hydroxybutyryl-CoA epimerase